jgi:hypothetical protein
VSCTSAEIRDFGVGRDWTVYFLIVIRFDISFSLGYSSCICQQPILIASNYYTCVLTILDCNSTFSISLSLSLSLTLSLTEGNEWLPRKEGQPGTLFGWQGIVPAKVKKMGGEEETDSGQ